MSPDPEISTDVDDIPKWISHDFLHEILQDELGLEEEITVLSSDINLAVKKGDNFLSVLYRVTVQFRRKNSEKLDTAHIMVKCFPPGEFMQTFVEEVGIFKREDIMYKEVLPKWYKFAESRMGKGKFERFSPKQLTTTRPDTIVLEDLKVQGYLMADRKKRLDFDHSLLVVRNIARLHALSLAYDEEHPGYLTQFHDTMFCEENRERLQQFVPPQMKGLVDVTKTWPGFEEISKKVEALTDSVVDKCIEACKLRDARYNVLSHGDCWVNNILFRYSSNGKPDDLRFIDYQITRYGSPALDLTYFLYTSPRSEVRVEYMDFFLEEYCRELRKVTSALKYTKEPITMEELQEEMHRLLFFGFVVTLTTMAIVIADEETTIDLKDLKADEVEKGDINVFEKIQSSAVYREALQPLLHYFDKLGILG